MNIMLWGVDIEPGDEILTTSLENPAALIPLRVYAERHGAVLRTLELGCGDVDLADAFRQNVTKRTRVVLASDSSCVTGARLDLLSLTRVAHEHGVLVFGDGVQSAGTCAIDVRESGIDGYAIARHKFLCGPASAGALYISPNALERIKPTFTGCFSDACHGDKPQFVPFPGARRFEVSTRSLPATAGATAAMKWLDKSVGWERIYTGTQKLADEIRESLACLDHVSVLTPENAPGALTAFTVEECDAGSIVKQLKKLGVATRPIRAPTPVTGVQTSPFAIRLSLGFWNRPDDVGRIVDAVSAAISSVYKK